MINLQNVICIFRGGPGFYNPVSYLICAMPLLLWAWITWRSTWTRDRMWLALAVIAPLTLLPVYHRHYDAKLLMLAVPACAMLWTEGKRIGRMALLVTLAGLLATADIPWTLFLSYNHVADNNFHHILVKGFLGLTQRDVLVSLGPLTLLGMSLFYLCVYWRRTTVQSAHAK